MTTLKTPYLTVDIIIGSKDGIVLVERKNKPAGWALPGGFVDDGESPEQAAVREAKEETSLDVTLLEQFHVYGKPGRDPRFNTVSVVYLAEGEGELKGGDDARRALLFAPDVLPEKIAFDHRLIIEDYVTYRRTGKRPALGR
jgi:8-oxo-dGTP diphosphatase